MFIIRDLLKFAEVDDWENGCLPDTGQSFDVQVSFTGKTADEVIGRVADFLGIADKERKESIERNACDEPGRVDFCKTENADGDELSAREMESWKTGNLKAWYCVYTGYVEELKPVTL